MNIDSKPDESGSIFPILDSKLDKMMYKMKLKKKESKINKLYREVEKLRQQNMEKDRQYEESLSRMHTRGTEKNSKIHSCHGSKERISINNSFRKSNNKKIAQALSPH